MIPDTYRDIIEQLVTRSVASEVRWMPTAFANQFIVNFSHRFSLAIASLDYERGLKFYRFTLRDSDGDPLDSFDVDPGDADHEIAEGLFALARRSALRIDEAIAEIRDVLQKSGEVGFDPDEIPF